MIRKSAIVPFNKSLAYKIVSQTQDYSKFLPFITKSSNIVRNQAHLTVSYGLFNEAFTSNVSLFENRILASASNSLLFNKLEAKWTFKEINDTCTELNLDVSWSFKSLVYSMVPISAFDTVSEIFLKSFVDRIHKVGKQDSSVKRLI